MSENLADNFKCKREGCNSTSFEEVASDVTVVSEVTEVHEFDFPSKEAELHYGNVDQGNGDDRSYFRCSLCIGGGFAFSHAELLAYLKDA